MKNLFIIAVLLLTTCITSCDKETDIVVDNELQAVSSLANFESNLSDGFSLVFFYATNCEFCVSQRPAVEALLENKDFDEVYFAEVRYGAIPEINQSYNVFLSPTIVIYQNGNEIYRYESAGHSEATLTQKLNELL